MIIVLLNILNDNDVKWGTSLHIIHPSIYPNTLTYTTFNINAPPSKHWNSQHNVKCYDSINHCSKNWTMYELMNSKYNFMLTFCLYIHNPVEALKHYDIIYASKAIFNQKYICIIIIIIYKVIKFNFTEIIINP